VLGVIAWLAGLAVIVGASVIGRDFGGPGATPRQPAAVATPPPSSARPRDAAIDSYTRISLVDGPMGVTVGEGSVWVVTSADLRLRRIDPATNAVTAIDLPLVPRSTKTTSGSGMSPAGHDLLPLVAVGAATVWVLGVPSARVLVGVDPASDGVLGTIRLPAPGTGIVSGPAGTWVTTDAGLLIGIDVAGGKLGPIVRFGRGRVAAAAGMDATWVSSSDGRILRLDRRGRVTARSDGGGGGPIAVGGGSVWVRSGQTLVQIDEHTGRSIGRHDVATSGDVSIAWALPTIGVLDYGDTVARVAPCESWMAETAGTLWMTHPLLGELWRIDRPG